MKKKTIFALTVMMIGIMATGCGSRAQISTTKSDQGNAANEMAYGMEAKAPKTGNGTSGGDTVNNQTETITEPSSGKENTDQADTSSAKEKTDQIDTSSVKENVDQTGTASGTGNVNLAQTDQNTTEAGITETQAKEKALLDAGVSENAITGIRIKKEKEDGNDIYDVEFYVGQQEYDYEIDILTGKILEKDYDIDKDFAHSLSADSDQMISQEEAVAIVLEKVNGASLEHVFIELEKDDGQWKYEGEIHYDQKEYEFEVNAMNGTILEWSEEGLRD